MSEDLIIFCSSTKYNDYINNNMDRKLQIYFIGVFWFILSTISSSFNDVISKHVGSNIIL